jgi:hypothetical protein
MAQLFFVYCYPDGDRNGMWNNNLGIFLNGHLRPNYANKKNLFEFLEKSMKSLQKINNNYFLKGSK